MFIGVAKGTLAKLNALKSQLRGEKDEMLRITVAQQIILAFLQKNKKGE